MQQDCKEGTNVPEERLIWGKQPKKHKQGREGLKWKWDVWKEIRGQ